MPKRVFQSAFNLFFKEFLEKEIQQEILIEKNDFSINQELNWNLCIGLEELNKFFDKAKKIWNQRVSLKEKEKICGNWYMYEKQFNKNVKQILGQLSQQQCDNFNQKYVQMKQINQPKKPQIPKTAFNMWFEENLQQLMLEHRGEIMIQIRKLAVEEWNELEQEEKDIYQQVEYKQKQEYEKQIIQYKIQYQNPGIEIEQEIEKIVNNIIIKENQNKQKKEKNEFEQQDKEFENQQQFQNYNINVNIGGNLNDMEIEVFSQSQNLARDIIKKPRKDDLITNLNYDSQQTFDQAQGLDVNNNNNNIASNQYNLSLTSNQFLKNHINKSKSKKMLRRTEFNQRKNSSQSENETKKQIYQTYNKKKEKISSFQGLNEINQQTNQKRKYSTQQEQSQVIEKQIQQQQDNEEEKENIQYNQ